MEEGVMYADLRFPPTPAPQQRMRLPWSRAALSLGLLSLMLLLAQIVLVSLSFHCKYQPSSAQISVEGVMAPNSPTPQQRMRLPWSRAALSLGLLSLMLLLAQIVLVSLSFHYLVQQQTSCTHGAGSIEESPSYGKHTLEGPCQFCPVGWLWEAGQCYYFSSAKKSWEQSREDCCSRGAQLVTIQANTTLAFLVRTAHLDAFHVGLKQDGIRSDWKWLDGTTLEGIFPLQRYTRSFQACGRVSGLGLLGGACTEALRWVCKQRAATLQWLQSSPPAFLWGNTTYSCVRP
ncbi:PREDICTED: killer cell lectin-like receptor subfamily G member 1 [Ficedula albicollis]|uniref:killer cell lectin-like receptor subfamily G member 1 n=1 Tax=Ficedula albicollis TaxID=59894 RepID=UPI0007AD7ECD|nr:PREDICTED: killer cell lectin-like receptor subfamily G member 1 [Ficedula albicollis]